SAATRLAAKNGSGPHCAGFTVQSVPLPRLACTKANLTPAPATLGQSIAPWKRETSIPTALVPAPAAAGARHAAPAPAAVAAISTDFRGKLTSGSPTRRASDRSAAVSKTRYDG